jgi:acyl-CoA reductase-like NAD-dependent aldehyde dehydrogenase
MVEREPVGVVLAISPFNYPLFISYTKVIPGLIAGNSVILKPPSAVPIPALMMARILDEAGIPKGAYSNIVAPGDIASYLATSDQINMITFTGSTSVGLELSNISGIKKIHLELGGKASAIVTKGAKNLQKVAKSIVDGSFKFSGQRCDAINRVLAESSLAPQLVESIVNEAKKFRLNTPEESPLPIGPLIDQSSAERVKGLIDDAVARGAKLILGGKINKNYVEPTVLSDVPLTARIMWEETFGPVIPIHNYFTEDEAVEISNKSEYGLDSAVFTDDITEALRIARKIEAGEVTINAFPAHGIGFFPFGGVKQSGFGREGIGFSIDEFTNMKTIVISTAE